MANQLITATMRDGRRVVVALTDDPCYCAAIKVGDDPELIVATVRPVASAEHADALAHTCRAAEAG
jgi:hypothetical protein